MTRVSKRKPLNNIAEQDEHATEKPPPEEDLSPSRQRRVLYLLKALALIVLAATYSPISQLTLSPVYGSVGASIYHNKGLIATVLFTIFARGEITNYLPGNTLSLAVPIYAFWVPTIQYIAFQYSSSLGNPNGPFWTECLTCYPLVAMSVYVALQYVDAADSASFAIAGIDISLPVGSFLFFALVRRAAAKYVLNNVGKYIFTTRIGMQMTVAILYAFILPSNLLLLAIPSVAFTTLGNVHAPFERTTNALNNTLATHNYTLLDRRESLTGYISVIENRDLKFRAMRCDHSLLGGEWIMSPRKGQISPVKEPIYAIFTVLEAVRLVKTDEERGGQQIALNIGLGIGTAPKALMAHGIIVDVMELDPTVHYFASKYFGPLAGLKTEIGDAVAAVESSIERGESQKYDYIIHDVFTGGAEPVNLFTMEFLSNLKTLLKLNGVIAINYAGDLSMPSASLIFRTINSVFPSCRVFREVEAPPADSRAIDFTNMVFFCTRNPKPIEFRSPIDSDFLGSGARQEHLLPKYEVPTAEFEHKGGVLSSSNTTSVMQLEKWQARSALGHWHVMRTVIPSAVWENW